MAKIIKLNIGGFKLTTTKKVEDMFFKQWEANKHNLTLHKKDYEIALMYFHIGHSLGFHHGFEAQRKLKRRRKE